MFSSLAIWTPFLFCSLVITNVKGVTIIPGALPKPYNGPSGASYASDFFQQSLPNDFLSISSTSSLLMSGRDDGYFERDDFQVLPSSSSFIRGAIQAWSEHLHLTLQPEQVWLAILTQLAFYLRCHSNDTAVTKVYDYHAQPQVEIQEYPDWYLVMAAFYGGVTDRCKADWVYDWLKPHFTTTTDDHVLAAHVIMLGLEPATVYILNKPMLCGLPSVTLDGTQADWELLLSKLDRLAEFGSEPALYGTRLKPILNRFVRGFQEPDGTSTKDFWNRIVLASTTTSCGAGAGAGAGAGVNALSGWITGFMFWDINGHPYGREDTKSNGGLLVLDNITYASLDVSTLPAGYGRAPFFIRNFNGTARYEAFAAAGPIGKRIDAGAPDGYLARLNATNMTAGYNASHHSTLTPLSSWGLFGPVIRDNTTNATAIREQRWVVEAELGRLASSLQKNANDTQCGKI
ncbi:hypothetical protein QBC46DRAFT_430346 [Diplogelasinospora grovesii]|uniref:Uncharacterized protein n=1 Tax=Diplogelasinospora grovesii TaxID=303347 RepID=A0AAN6NH48_9PEZI|nr:hypothetical protein QBC46DRAFT_430346 [Diplogelasinospora grovesii]